MVAETPRLAVKWSDILDRLMMELESAQKSHMWGDLTLTIKFENGLPVAEKIGTVKTRKLQQKP